MDKVWGKSWLLAWPEQAWAVVLTTPVCGGSRILHGRHSQPAAARGSPTSGDSALPSLARVPRPACRHAGQSLGTDTGAFVAGHHFCTACRLKQTLCRRLALGALRVTSAAGIGSVQMELRKGVREDGLQPQGGWGCYRWDCRPHRDPNTWEHTMPWSGGWHWVRSPWACQQPPPLLPPRPGVTPISRPLGGSPPCALAPAGLAGWVRVVVPGLRLASGFHPPGAQVPGARGCWSCLAAVWGSVLVPDGVSPPLLAEPRGQGGPTWHEGHGGFAPPGPSWGARNPWQQLGRGSGCPWATGRVCAGPGTGQARTCLGGGLDRADRAWASSPGCAARA